jgi:hypothetical protein
MGNDSFDWTANRNTIQVRASRGRAPAARLQVLDFEVIDGFASLCLWHAWQRLNCLGWHPAQEGDAALEAGNRWNCLRARVHSITSPLAVKPGYRSRATKRRWLRTG